MGLRPTDIQLILQVTRDVERIQNLQQQYSRQQQEHLATYMRKSLYEKREKTEPLGKGEKASIRQVSSQEQKRSKERKGKKKQQQKDGGTGSHIDIIA